MATNLGLKAKESVVVNGVVVRALGDASLAVETNASIGFENNTGLRIPIKPNERILINGAVIRNTGDTKVLLNVETTAEVLLKEKDFMREDEATTPARRLYYLCMLAYVDEASRETHREQFVNWLSEFVNALRNPTAIAAAAEAGEEVNAGRYHKALVCIRALIDYEDLAMGRSDRATEAA